MKRFWCFFLILFMAISLLGCNTTPTQSEYSNAPEGYYLAKTSQTFTSSENEYLNQSTSVQYDALGRVVERAVSRGSLFTSIKFTYKEDGRIASILYERTDTHQTQKTLDITYKKVSLAEVDLSEKYPKEYFDFPDEFYVGTYNSTDETAGLWNFMFAYDEEGNLIFEKNDFFASPTFYSYHPNGEVKTKASDMESFISLESYDEQGNMLSSKQIRKDDGSVFTENTYTWKDGAMISQESSSYGTFSSTEGYSDPFYQRTSYENGIIKSIKTTENGTDTELVFTFEKEENGIRCYSATDQNEGSVYKFFYDNLNRHIKMQIFNNGESEYEQTVTYHEDTNYSIKNEVKIGDITQITENTYEKK